MPRKSPYTVVRLIATLILTLSTGVVVPAAQAALKTIYETQKFTDPDGVSHDKFGGAVAISGDLAIVGALYDDDKGSNSGSAYIYAFDGTSWNLQTKLTASDAIPELRFGTSVAIAGNMALIGAPWDSTLGSLTGTVYVFTFDGTTWTQQAKLFPSDPVPSSLFGESVALSGDTALVGAFLGGPGSAYVFKFDGTAWSEQAKLTAADGASGDYFGLSVSLSGNRALIGAYEAGIGGAAYVFSSDGTTWSQEAKLTGLDTREGDSFGLAVSLAGDRALVGAPARDQFRGAAYIFAFDGTSWSQQTKLKITGGMKYDNFGSSVALSDTVALVGANKFADPGLVYQYSFRRNIWTLKAQLLASDGVGGDYLGVSVALSGNTVLAGADHTFSSTDIGAAYIFSLGRQR